MSFVEIALLAGFFLFVMGAISAAGYFLVWRAPGAAQPGVQEPLNVVLGGPQAGGMKAVLLDFFHSLGEATPIAEADRKATRTRLDQAGYRWPSALPIYYGVKIASAGVLAAILALVTIYTREDGLLYIALAGACGLGFGFLIPDRVLDALVRARNDRLRRALPPALDLMVMTLEAGQSLDQAMLAASRGLKNLYPDLCGELAQVHLETRASKSRGEALWRMAERNSEQDIRKLCQLLHDSDRFGASLGPAMRSHAKYLRIRFRQRAQEAARKLGVKLVFPIFFLIFPTILLVTLGPAVMLMSQQFRKLFGE